MNLKGVEVHPAANIFPMMSDVELKALAEDIKLHGQRDWCVRYKGKLVDGRNRWKACELIGIEPDVCDRDDEDTFDPVAYVLSTNLHRRHLSTAQRAMAAAELKKLLEPEAKERKRAGKSADGKAGGRGKAKNLGENLPQGNSKTRDQAAAMLNVSGRSVDHAATVLTKGSGELIAAVKSGAISLSRAASAAKKTEKPKQLQKAMAKPKKEKPSYFDKLKTIWDKSDETTRCLFRNYIDGNL